MATIFSLSSVLVMPFWFLLIVLPHWRWTKRILQSPLVVVAAALLYAALVLPQLGQVLPAVLNPTLTGIMALLNSPTSATIAWVHFLAFDLFVGRWAYLDSRERDINAWLMAPILLFILMLGPIGFLLYMICRGVYTFLQSRKKQSMAIAESQTL
ncbi:MAG: ABA4-like family protein [Ktedonobacteraceae bacterium]